jgi:hypothetical protein
LFDCSICPMNDMFSSSSALIFYFSWQFSLCNCTAFSLSILLSF